MYTSEKLVSHTPLFQRHYSLEEESSAYYTPSTFPVRFVAKLFGGGAIQIVFILVTYLKIMDVSKHKINS